MNNNDNETNNKESITSNLTSASNKGPEQGANAGRGPKRRPYGQLIGAIDQGTSSTRFLVFENQTGRLVASSQIEIKRITPKEGWVEMCPTAIMSSVYATIANVHEQLEAKQQQQQQQQQRQPTGGECSSHWAPRNLLKCIGICNQRESTVVWDSVTGQPLYNVIVWMDNRTKDLVDNMIDSIPGRDFNWLKDKTGLPMSTYFSAFKLKWLIENVAAVREALHEKRLLFGTVDSWILWNLTGRHLTDVTNASRTFLMDIESLQWDKSLCKQLKIPMEILPRILASADDFGALRSGPFRGTPITGVIGDQSAALLGQNCLQLGQTKATLGTGCFIMQNIGPGPLNGALSGVHRSAKRGLITTVGYKLGDRPACYALEGSIKIAGAALTWLRDNLQLIENYEQCDQLINKTSNSAGVFFVPALGGLYSPYWDPNAAGLFIGLSQFTKREHMVRATFDAIAFQTNDILSLMRGVVNGLMIDGGLCKSDNLCQILADITGYDIVRPSMCETSALGAAMVAGYGAGIWNLESMMANSNTSYEYSSLSNQNHHYPHESLNYEEKFSSLIQSKSFKSSSSGARANENNNNNNNKPDKQKQFAKARSQQQQANKQTETNNNKNNNNRNIRKGQINCQFDAGGGGVNDDAGGGGRERAPVQQVFTDSDSLDEASGACGHKNRGQKNNCKTFSQSSHIMTTDKHPQLEEPSVALEPMESSYESEIVAIIGANENNGPRVDQTNLSGDEEQKIARFYAAPNSDYSSGDNLELATSNSAASCQLTDPSSSCTANNQSRIDSPVSSSTQATSAEGSLLNGRDSAATCTTDLTASHNQIQTQSDPAKRLAMGTDNHCHHHCGTATGNSFAFQLATTNSNDSTNYLSNNGTKYNVTSDVEEEEEEEEEEKSSNDNVGDVHAFGGRDSYGEDGYDSSTASNFDSEDDESDYEDRSSVGDDDGQPLSIIDASAASGQSKCKPHRARLLSTTTKPVDVFQSYISLEHRTDLVGTWRLAVGRSMEWTKVHHEEIRRIDYQRLSSLPISMYLFFSIGLVALSSVLSPLSIGRN